MARLSRRKWRFRTQNGRFHKGGVSLWTCRPIPPLVNETNNGIWHNIHVIVFWHGQSSVSFACTFVALASFCITTLGFIRLCILAYGIRGLGHCIGQPQHVFKTPLMIWWQGVQDKFSIRAHGEGPTKIPGIWAGLSSKIISLQKSTCTIRIAAVEHGLVR
jgi:hypothetical protein